MQEASLMLVLKGLGVPNDQLQNVRNADGVYWILGSETFVYRGAILDKHQMSLSVNEVQQSSMHFLHFHAQSPKEKRHSGIPRCACEWPANMS